MLQQTGKKVLGCLPALWETCWFTIRFTIYSTCAFPPAYKAYKPLICADTQEDRCKMWIYV